MGRPKKGPPLIRSDYFTEESDLTVDELRAISISTLADIPTFLTAVNWNGGAYAVITLRLSPIINVSFPVLLPWWVTYSQKKL